MVESREIGSVARIFSGCLVGAMGLAMMSINGLLALAGLAILLGEPGEASLAATSVFAVLSLIGMVITWGGYRLGRSGHKIGEQSRQTAAQRRILELARARGGRLTLAEVLLETRMDQDSAQGLLDAMFKQGLADLRIADSGQDVYVFAALSAPAETADAPELLEADDDLETIFEQLAAEEEARTGRHAGVSARAYDEAARRRSGK